MKICVHLQEFYFQNLDFPEFLRLFSFVHDTERYIKVANEIHRDTLRISGRAVIHGQRLYVSHSCRSPNPDWF